MRVNAPLGGYDFAGEKMRKKTPRGVYHDSGFFLKAYFGAFRPPGRYLKKKKKKHTPSQTRGDTKIKKKSPHLSHADSNSKAAAGVDDVATEQHRQVIEL